MVEHEFSIGRQRLGLLQSSVAGFHATEGLAVMDIMADRAQIAKDMEYVQSLSGFWTSYAQYFPDQMVDRLLEKESEIDAAE